MPADLEEFTTLNGEHVYGFAFTGGREDIWHRLGQSFDGRAMTAEEAMRESHMNRNIRIVPVAAPEGAHWAIPERYFVVLEGDNWVTPEGELVSVPDKVVGEHGEGGADAHANFTIYDRFLYAEEAIRVSNGEAVWSTAGSLRDGTQGFATMEAPPIIIDPDGINDIVRRYVTVTWSFDGSMSTVIGSSNVRAVCANTVAMHLDTAIVLVKVKHTSATATERYRVAAEAWARSQNEAEALKLKAERMVAVRGRKMDLLNKIIEKFEPAPPEDASQRTKTLHTNRVDQIRTLSYASTNDIGDNGWAAWNTYVEFLDWEAPVKCAKGESEMDRRLGNQFDGTYDTRKADVADFVLSLS